jgi:hypothetical protein
MGYWSHHPMGGDTPLDFKDNLLSRYDNVEDENKEYFYFDRPIEEIKFFIERDLKELLEKSIRDKNFSLPWIIIEYNIDVPEEFREPIKKLIGCDIENINEEQPTKENNWNDFKSPLCFCEQLKFYWNDIMNKTIKSDDVLEDNIGLVETIFKAMEENKTGLVNVNR